MCLCSLAMCPQVGEITGHGKGRERKRDSKSRTSGKEIVPRNTKTKDKQEEGETDKWTKKIKKQISGV